MLTSDLARVRCRGNNVEPLYVDENDKNLLEMAENLVAIYQEHEGKTREELKSCLTDLLEEQTLLCRGLSKLLEDRCQFSSSAGLDTESIRASTFSLSTLFHQEGRFERQKVLEEVAAQHSLQVADVESALFADLKNREFLQKFETISPEMLLKRYNTALAQTVLYKATELSIQLRETDPLRYRQLFRWVKFHRLLYQITLEKQGVYRLLLDGPLSLFSASQKYGVQMAVFLPALLLCPDWSLQAKILWGKRKKTLLFSLDASKKLYSHYQDTGMYQPPEWKPFLERFQSLGSEWEIQEHTDILMLGPQEICIPNYVVRHRPSENLVYIEIFGFWNEAALRKRLQLSLTQKMPLLLAVPRKLCVDTEKNIVENNYLIYFFHEVLNPHQVLHCLNQFLLPTKDKKE